ncbi:uncharacterized protein K441DRAFT_654541, partial [Cenococcum geophilum 1.58]|uniref:uncharacterized protein n=1 Tax=Cenococcum geophilum 1.58 TaxID=794803 RepID=UPI00358EBE34
GVPKQAYIIAIPTILRGLALKYYFTYLKDLNLKNVCIGLKLYFKGNEYKRDILLNDIKSLIATYGKQEPEIELFYTNRRYYPPNR